jgi:hypothetical protein
MAKRPQVELFFEADGGSQFVCTIEALELHEERLGHGGKPNSLCRSNGLRNLLPIARFRFVHVYVVTFSV